MAPGAGKNSAVLKVVGDNADAQRTIAETIRSVEKMGQVINTQSQTAVRAFRAEADAAKALLTQLGASEKQMDSLARTTQRVNSQAAAHLSRLGGAARGVASGFEAMARTGNVAGEASKQILTQGAEIAFLFGPTGAIAGAVAIGGLAIVNYFQRSRKEMEETRKKAETELLALARSASIMGVAERMTSLTSGDAAAQLLASRGALGRDLTADELGISGLERRLQQNRATLAQRGGVRSVASGTGGVAVLNADLATRIANDEKELLRLKKDRNAVEVIYHDQLRKTGEMAQAALSIAEYERDLKKEKKALTEEEQRQAQFEKQNQTAAIERYVAGLQDSLALTRELRAVAEDETRSWEERINAARRLEEIEQRRLATQREALREMDRAAGRGMALGAPSRTAPDGVQIAAAAAPGDRTGMSRLIEEIETADALMLDFGNAAAAAMNAFATGAESAGEAFKKSMLAAIAAVASQKGALNLAEAVSATAEGFKLLANPLTAPFAGLSFKAAGDHAAAAAMFFAIGGGAAALASRGGGGGGGGAGGRAAGRQAERIGDIESRPMELHFHGGILDPNDPRQVDQIAAMFEKASGRNVIVTSHG